MTRLEQHYRDNVMKELQAQFSYQSPMEIPRITKITLNMGVGEASQDKKVVENAVEDMALYQDVITKLLNDEVRLLSSRLSELPPEKVATMIEQVVPILDHYIMRLHSTKIREFFANVL